MNGLNLATLPWAVQVTVAAGYLGYIIAYAGLRRGHQSVDVAFMTLAFGVPAMLIMLWRGDAMPGAAGVGGVVSGLVLGAVWRVVGRAAWLGLMKALQVHQEDGTASAWDAMIQRQGLDVNQVSVRTKDGRTLFMSDRRPYDDQPHQGLILGANGDIVMVVEKERLKDGGDDRAATGIIAAGGLRVAYIPASEVAQVNLRIT